MVDNKFHYYTNKINEKKANPMPHLHHQDRHRAMKLPFLNLPSLPTPLQSPRANLLARYHRATLPDIFSLSLHRFCRWHKRPRVRLHSHRVQPVFSMEATHLYRRFRQRHVPLRCASQKSRFPFHRKSSLAKMDRPMRPWQRRH